MALGEVRSAGIGVGSVVDAVGSAVTAVVGLPAAIVSGAAALCSPTALVRTPAGQRVLGFAHGAFGELPAPRRDASCPDTLPAAMSVRSDHRRVRLDPASLAAAFPAATGRLVLFLHGLVDTERSWFPAGRPGRRRAGTDFGRGFAAELGCTPLHLRYNSGRHVSDNGRELVDLLDELVAAWPVEVTDVVLVGHSMGGLVARSAAHRAHERAAPWASRLTRVVCLGSPHTGAPLERAVARTAEVLDGLWPAAPLCRLLALRSDGIKDLAEGYLHEHQWRGVDDGAPPPSTALPPGVRQLFVAATLTSSPDSALGRLVGDLVVDPESAAAPDQEADRCRVGGVSHFALQTHDDVYRAVLDWLRETDPAPVPAERTPECTDPAPASTRCA
ncbi:lipase family alpha/beta hydrolase [Saccharothrix sp. Mg75]|uniref:lipase family alpha/beta hydrolase n=1 Tax=Saccharothrix sp. Mg75 TaxID=3445357 RepID=UPI003EED7DD4